MCCICCRHSDSPTHRDILSMCNATYHNHTWCNCIYYGEKGFCFKMKIMMFSFGSVTGTLSGTFCSIWSGADCGLKWSIDNEYQITNVSECALAWVRCGGLAIFSPLLFLVLVSVSFCNRSRVWSKTDMEGWMGSVTKSTDYEPNEQ